MYGVVFVQTDTNNSSLSHHGTKGQKWGIRKYQYRDGSLTPEGYKHYGYSEKKKSGKTGDDQTQKSSGQTKGSSNQQSESTKAEVAPKKKISEMSDDELRNYINRMRLEQDYKRAVSESQPKKVEKQKMIDWKRIGSDIVTTSVKNVGTNVATNVGTELVNKFGREVLNLDYDLAKKGKSDEKKK